MANTILNADMITREALAVLHEKLSFIGTINREYDSSFARSGAKIGNSLRIRKPAKYVVRTGAPISTQDHEEESTTLTVSTQKGVDVTFTTDELTMKLDDFSSNVLEPQMAVLASDIEADVLQGVTQAVYNQVGTPGTTPAGMLVFGQARAKLNQYLAPKDNMRCVQMDSLTMASMVDANKGLFHESNDISRAYLEGFIGRNAGFKWYENEKVYVHTNGADVAGLVNDAGGSIASGDTSIPVDGFTAAPEVGSIFTLAGVNAVHGETKQDYGFLQQFVVTAATTTSITFDPPLYSASTGKQNVTGLPADNAAVTFSGALSTSYEQHLAYHKNVATFATADLVMPEGVHFASRQVFDGISMRIVRQYDIATDKIPCRIDVLYGYKTIRPELGCRITG